MKQDCPPAPPRCVNWELPGPGIFFTHQLTAPLSKLYSARRSTAGIVSAKILRSSAIEKFSM